MGGWVERRVGGEGRCGWRGHAVLSDALGKDIISD